MIECRRIQEWDVQAVVNFAIQGMQLERYPLRLDEKKVLHWIRLFMPEDSPHYSQAAFHGGALVGAVAAFVTELPFFERCEAHVVMCRATEPGVGRRLIRFMMEWARNNMLVRRVVFPLEEHADPRQAMLLGRFGFTRQQQNLIYYKG